jgi:hypothetical protein
MGNMDIPMISSLFFGKTAMIKSEMNMPFGGKIIQGFDGQNAWINSPQGSAVLPPDESESILENIFSDPVNMLCCVVSGKYSANFSGETEFNGKKAMAVEVSDGRFDATIYISVKDGELLGKSYMSKTQQGESMMTEYFTDWRSTGKIKLPYKVETISSGEPFSTAVVSKVSVNTGLKEEFFRMN